MSIKTRPSTASTSKATKDAGDSFASLATREAAGCSRKLQRVEVEPLRSGDHDLAVDHDCRWNPLQQRVMQLREVAIEGPEVAALNVDVFLCAEDDGPKAVPLGLEDEAFAGRQRVDQLGEHRFNRRNHASSQFARLVPSGCLKASGYRERFQARSRN